MKDFLYRIFHPIVYTVSINDEDIPCVFITIRSARKFVMECVKDHPEWTFAIGGNELHI